MRTEPVNATQSVTPANIRYDSHAHESGGRTSSGGAPPARVRAASSEADPSREITETQLHQAVDELNKAAQLSQKKLQFRLHSETDRMMVQVVDAQTREVINELPPEKVLDAAAKMIEFIGMLLDERV